jgi:CheY-like chemotaxis protein
MAWLWLAGVTEAPRDAIIYLKCVLSINPASERARAGLHAVRFQAGVAEARAGNHAAARTYFQTVVAAEPAHAGALLWLAVLAETAGEAVTYLDRVLAADPNHGRARQLRDDMRARVKPAGGNHGPRVLVVDADAKARNAIGQALGQAGYAVLAAGNGPEAIDRIADDGVPDLIFVDVVAAATGGFQVCSVFRESAAMRAVPVVLLTGKPRFIDKVRGRLAGAAAHVTKPFTADQITAAAQRHARAARPRHVDG